MEYLVRFEQAQQSSTKGFLLARDLLQASIADENSLAWLLLRVIQGAELAPSAAAEDEKPSPSVTPKSVLEATNLLHSMLSLAKVLATKDAGMAAFCRTVSDRVVAALVPKV